MKLTLRAARVNKGYTQKTAAKLIGVTKDMVCNWERGVRTPNVKLVSKIEEVYGVNYNELIFFTTENALSVGKLS
jgi:Predicted transcriptional regulators